MLCVTAQRYHMSSICVRTCLDTVRLSKHTDNMKLANAFTSVRIVFAPVFFFIYFIPIWTGRFVGLSAALMIPFLMCMECTDFLDGFFARKKGEVSDFGKMFDPFADVILHLTTFACFMHSFSPIVKSYLPVIIFILIVYREFSQNFLRMVAAKQGTAIAARKGGKLKTVFYVASGFVCLIPECALRFFAAKGGDVGGIVSAVAQHTAVWKNAALGMFIVSLALSYISFADYLVHFKSLLKDM